ncbi:unnamed protein product [Ambrosiozyma monospora]|uniref:Unnamed protein product n=1 Tax=Ambrosiozyma monospora TaxID=43982 RepID=A0ACB5TBJ5_AMBMO|nr:unnamed protein product [Ambrosiozyma monospora]
MSFSAQDKLLAHENTLKIENAIKQMKNRDDPDSSYRDPTIYVDDQGQKFRTTERIMKGVPPPTTKKLREVNFSVIQMDCLIINC